MPLHKSVRSSYPKTSLCFQDPSLGGFAYGKYGEPGNFGTGYWGRKIQDPAERAAKLTTELNNGRLAMVAMTAMLIQNGLTGQSPVESW